MKKWTISLAALLWLVPTIRAQVGLQGGFGSLRSSEWTRAIETRTTSSLNAAPGWYTGIDYWFRLKKKRIEFNLAALYGQYDQGLSQGGKLKIQQVGLLGFVNVYPLDLGSDCYCPTWSKSGDVFSKGFFLQVFAGGVQLDKSLRHPQLELDHDQMLPVVGIGVGLDIGVSEPITLTPMIRYGWMPGAEWPGLEEGEKDRKLTTVGMLWAGLRLGFRFDRQRF